MGAGDAPQQRHRLHSESAASVKPNSRIRSAENSMAEREITMPRVPAFYSINEALKAPQHRVHHDNSACPSGRDIPSWERRPGTGGYRLCENCDRLDREGR